MPFLQLDRAPGFDKHQSQLYSKICVNLNNIFCISKDRIDENISHIRVDTIWIAVLANYEELIKIIDTVNLPEEEKPKKAKKAK